MTDANGCISDAYSIEVDITDGIAEPVIVSNGPVCEGEIVTLEIQEYIGSSVTYSWRHNGFILPAFTSNEITFNPATIGNAGCLLYTSDAADE